jgi:predicted AlkP superfamily phosphohydrolase/phosphomutase
MTNCKVLFFALDSADPALLTQWMDGGSLPNLASLRSRSIHGGMETPRALGSDAIWPSVFTGVDPSKHGRYYHKQDQAGSYRATGRRCMDVMCDPIWLTLSNAGRRVAVLDMPKAPITEGLNGIQVLDWHSHYSYPEEFRTWPPEHAQFLAENFGDHTTCPCVSTRYQDYDPAGDMMKIAGLRSTIDETQAMIMHQLDDGPWDLFMTAFSASHCVGHQCWHLHDTTHPRWKIATATADDPIHEIYIAIDAALGTLLARLDDETSIMVFAGAATGPSYVRHDLLDEILVRLDKGRSSASRQAMKSLKSLWHLVPKDWRKGLSGAAHLAENTLTAHDRSQRRFFATRANDTVGGIRINLQGREPSGQVAPDTLDAICDELIHAISEIRIVDTGAPLVTDIVRADTVYHGEHLDQLPDILIEWNHEAPIRSIASPAIGTIYQDRLPDWSGTHRAGAFAMISAPGVTPSRFPEGSTIYDIAPTLAALCGLNLPGTDGRPLVGVHNID